MVEILVDFRNYSTKSTYISDNYFPDQILLHEPKGFSPFYPILHYIKSFYYGKMSDMNPTSIP